MKDHSRFIPMRLPMVALLLCAMLSCVKEERVDCPDPRGNVRLTVGLDARVIPTRAETGGYSIEQAHLYVFDSAGSYVTSAEGGFEGEEFSGEYEFWLTLPAGEYDFVVWTNQGGHYCINQTVEELQQGEYTMSDLELYLDHGGETLTDHIPHLLHGITRAETIIDAIDNHVEVAITPLTYTVNLKALNLPDTDHTYDFTITDNNSHYDFEGNLIEGKAHFDHTRTDTAPEGEFNASIRTLTLSADRNPRFSFTDTTDGTVMYDADLINAITKAYATASRAVDFTNVYTFDIVLSFDPKTMDFSVSVNGWEHDQRYEILD